MAYNAQKRYVHNFLIGNNVGYELIYIYIYIYCLIICRIKQPHVKRSVGANQVLELLLEDNCLVLMGIVNIIAP